MLNCIYTVKRACKHKKAFTLVELSIVIVIIGLIIGGVTAGSSIVHQAKLQGIISDYSIYKGAVQSFRLQYNALPGDMKNASDYWSATADCVAAPVQVNGVLQDGCNGNGDKKIASFFTYPQRESLRFWQHLTLSKTLPGSYSGKGSGGIATDYTHIPGVNTPQGSFNGSCWHVDSQPTSPKIGYLWLGKPGGGGCQVGFLLAKDAYVVDKKIDDGLYGSKGGVISGISFLSTGWPPDQSDCVGAGGAYNLSGTNATCSLIMELL